MKIKDENGNEIEVFTQADIDAAKAESLKEVSAVREKLGITDQDDFNAKLDDVVLKAKKTADWERVKGGKEKTWTEAQTAVINQLKAKGVDATVNENGEVVINNQATPQQVGITSEQAEEAAKKVLADHEFSTRKNSLIGSLNEDKRKDVDSFISDLRGKGISGDANQLFNMAIAALGVETPRNSAPGNNGSFNNMFNFGNNQEQKSQTDFADSAAGKQIMRNMGMNDEQISKSAELSSGKKIITDKKMTNEGGSINNYNDLNK